jgi:hypothetical protein
VVGAPPGYGGDNGFASNALLNMPTGLWLTTCNLLYFADMDNHRIRKIVTNIITTVVNNCGGNCNGGYIGDQGPAISAQVNRPRGIYMDTAGKLYIADSENNRVRMVYVNNIISTIAGSGSELIDGIPATSAFIKSYDVKGDSLGNIYIADYANHGIRVGDRFHGIISTLFGSSNRVSGFTPGLDLRSSSISNPVGIWYLAG